ncbi:hypothetical protein WDW89_15370 [Deltaproteobacteria bacterium TL4]
MNARDLKRYLSEIILGILTLFFLVSAYLFAMSYFNAVSEEHKLQNEKRQLNEIKQQIALYPQITEKETNQWENIRRKFVDQFPMEAALPRRIMYSSINKSFQGVDIPVEALSLYEMLYKITRETRVPNIEIIPVKDKDPFENEKIQEFLSTQLIQFRFISDYSNIFWFVKELRQLPFVLEVVSLRMERSEGLVDVIMLVGFYNRKKDDPFPKY